MSSSLNVNSGIQVANINNSTVHGNINTQALVTALTERLEIVELYGVTLDIQTFCQYNGRGTCRELRVNRDTRERYGERLKQWGEEVGWAVIEGILGYLVLKRK